MTSTATETRLFGREAEQAQLQALLDDARARRSGSLVLIGEPGAGKSALIDEIRFGVNDMTVLEARGVESEAELPFASLHQLLRPVLGLLERLPGAAGGGAARRVRAQRQRCAGSVSACRSRC